MSEYKKMAGTAAVFLRADHKGASPVERDGMIWSDDELHLKDVPEQLMDKPQMANVLALEGLEDYQPAAHGDYRFVASTGVSFVYVEALRGWVEHAGT